MKHNLTDDIYTCAICGNKGHMYLICEGAWSYYTEKEWDPTIRQEIWFPIADVKWQIIICSVCESVNILKTEKNYVGSMVEFIDTPEGTIEVDIDPVTTDLIYPNLDHNFHNLPQLVSDSYSTALRLLHIEPTASVVFFGRTLEFMCIEQNAIGKDLDAKIKDLTKRSIIPSNLEKMAHNIRLFRNIGAHANIEKITEDDVLDLRVLCEAILEYVYEAPAKLAHLQKRLNKIDERLKKLKSSKAGI